MIEDADGKPKVGPAAKKLGVRGLENPDMQDVNVLLPTDLVMPGIGGMSVAPDDPFYLVAFLHTRSMGGNSPHPIWVIDESDLGSDLITVFDTTQHRLICPVRPMTRMEFEAALASTRDRWLVYCR